jgi:hypothetical protein
MQQLCAEWAAANFPVCVVWCHVAAQDDDEREKEKERERERAAAAAVKAQLIAQGNSK